MLKPTISVVAFIPALLLALPGQAAQTESEPIQTDRPDFVDSSEVVAKGVFQLETSYAVEIDRHDGRRFRTWTTPTLIRIGMGDDWEFRIETDGRIGERTYSSASAQATTHHGYGDLAFGAKWHSCDQDGSVPAMGWQVHADFDSGSKDFRGHGMRPSVRFSAEWEMGDGYSIGVMPGAIYDKTEQGKRYFAGIFGVVLGKSLSERLRTFIEVAAPQIARGRHGGSFVTYDTGFAYLLDRESQVDVIVQKAANHNTPDFSWAIGYSRRFR